MDSYHNSLHLVLRYMTQANAAAAAAADSAAEMTSPPDQRITQSLMAFCAYRPSIASLFDALQLCCRAFMAGVVRVSVRM